MNNIHFIPVLLFLSMPVISTGQELQSFSQDNPTLTVQEEKKTHIYGFVRGGLYASKDDNNKPYISSAYSDFGLKVESGNDLNFKAFADIRFRYGSEFQIPVTRLDIREAFVTVNGKKWDLSAGQKIIKWGRADFTNPTSKLSPVNYISRSPDPEDMNLGNLLISGRWSPASQISINAVAVPFFRSSTLLIDPIPIPWYVTISEIDSLVTDQKMFSYGLKTDFHFQGIDMSFSWFDGYDPMPGTALTNFNLDLSGPYPVPYTGLTMTPYKIRNLGFDFETTFGSTGFRGEASWSNPYESYQTYEYVPCEEIKWVAGMDWSTGNWRFTGEYSGKFIPDFIPASVDPILGAEPDYAELAALLATPGFNMEDYVRDQVRSFNRLYNYQLEEQYHSAGLRIEADLLYGRLTPSVFTIYNFTSRDFLLIPAVKIKPVDRLTIDIGFDYYLGRDGSLYDIVNEFMNCFTVALRVDF